MTQLNDKHFCLSSNCGCGFTRRDWLKFAALSTVASASPLLRAGDVMAQNFKGDDQPVKVGYLPITDATPLLVAQSLKLYEAEGLKTEPPRLFRSWAQVVEAFVGGQVNVIHLLSPAALWVRYGTKFPAKVTMWNHINGSALTVASNINSINDLGGKVIAVPFWYSIHNILIQRLLREANLVPVTKPKDAPLAANEVSLIILPPAEMVSALASKSISGFIVADPFNAAAELAGISKVLRFSGDIWQNHACCVTFLAERDIVGKPEWTQRVNNALVKAQLWTKNNQLETALLLSSSGEGRYTPQPARTLSKVLASTDYESYITSGVVRNKNWKEKRIDFQPYPFPSYTEELVKQIKLTKIEGDNKFLDNLDPAFVAKDLVDDRFVKKSITAVGGPKVFDLPSNFSRKEALSS